MKIKSKNLDKDQSIYIGLGANLGHAEDNIRAAIFYLNQDPQTSVVCVSPFYQTPAWGIIEQPDFINAAAELKTTRSPQDFLSLCLSVEEKLQRVRLQKWGARNIDIDILLFKGLSMNEENLKIPHPHMHERAFVLLPLFNIAPHLTLKNESICDALAKLEIRRIRKVSSFSSTSYRDKMFF